MPSVAPSKWIPNSIPGVSTGPNTALRAPENPATTKSQRKVRRRRPPFPICLALAAHRGLPSSPPRLAPPDRLTHLGGPLSPVLASPHHPASSSSGRDDAAAHTACG